MYIMHKGVFFKFVQWINNFQEYDNAKFGHISKKYI
jgi:hypothetical protein